MNTLDHHARIDGTNRFETTVVTKKIDLREDPLMAILILQDGHLHKIQIMRNPRISQMGTIVDHGLKQWKDLLIKIIDEVVDVSLFEKENER